MGNYLHAVKVDASGKIYLLASYSGEFIETSPVSIVESIGSSDVLLIKLEKDGRLIDAVSSGSLAQDEGLGLALDKDQNIYLTGYISGEAVFDSLITSPTSGGKDLFVGKIPYQRFIPGKSGDSVLSWMGNGSWNLGDRKIFDKEFEIPVGTVVFINPLDSNIPGKNGHVWRLKDTVTGETIIDIKDVAYFIWNFKIPGYYTLEIEIKDSNGNVYTDTKPGYIRVVDHTAQFTRGVVPHPITSEDFRKQSLY
jgi:hypothetical protein